MAPVIQEGTHELLTFRQNSTTNLNGPHSPFTDKFKGLSHSEPKDRVSRWRCGQCYLHLHNSNSLHKHWLQRTQGSVSFAFSLPVTPFLAKDEQYPANIERMKINITKAWANSTQWPYRSMVPHSAAKLLCAGSVYGSADVLA